MRQIKSTAFAALAVTSAFLLVLSFAPFAGGAPKGAPVPGLGNYPNPSIALSTDTTVTPDAAPTNTTRMNVSTSTNFKGTLEGNPTTGVVRVTDAHPAGVYTVTITAFSSGGATTTKMFTLTVTTPATCTPVSFAAATNFGAGTGPASVAVGDFNGDGKQDVALANFTSNNVSILLGDGAGSFGAATNFGAGTQPVLAAVGDFNGDGKQDLAVANFGSNNVSILMGDGAGSFSVPTNFGVGTNPIAVAAGDFNGDGKKDLAVANFGSNNVSILLGDGAGSFSVATSFGAGTNPFFLAVGNFNGDSNQDLAVANFGSNNVSILFGNGAGSFSAASNFAAGSQPASLAVGNFSADSNQDLAVANFSSDNVSILLGDGAGSFSAPSDFGVGTDPDSVAVGDFNGDGKQDLAVSNRTSGDVSTLLGDGAGSFSAATNFGAGTEPVMVAVGDFNGGGQQDLAVANFASNNVSILLRDCGATPSPTPTSTATATAAPTATATSTATATPTATIPAGTTPTPTPTQTATPSPSLTPPPGTFIKGININGNAAVINGNPWISYASALASGFATSNLGYTTSITYSPPVDGPTSGMLNTGIWCPACNVNFSQTIANGNYDIYLWAVENYVSNYRSYNVKLEGAQVAAAIGTLSVNTWLRYGPYSVTVSDGVLNVNLVRITGDPLVQGVEIWAAGTATPSPTPAPSATAAPFPIPGTFNAVAAQTLIAPMVTQASPAPNGSIVQHVQNINPTTTGYAIYNVQVNATGNYLLKGKVNWLNGGSNSMIAKFGSQPSSTDIWDGAPTTGFEDRYFVDPGLTTPHVFSLTAGATTLYIGGREADAFLSTITVEAVSTPTPTPTTTPSPGAFVKGININGNAAVINGNPWISYASALASGFATSNPGYTTSITYSPPVDGPTNGMLNTGIWCPACNVNFSQTIANGNYDIYLWAVENYVSNYRSYNVKLEGAQVAAAIGTLSVNTWLRYGPYSVTVSDGVLNVNLVRITGDPLVQGVEIWAAGTATPSPTPAPSATAAPFPIPGTFNAVAAQTLIAPMVTQASPAPNGSIVQHVQNINPTTTGYAIYNVQVNATGNYLLKGKVNWLNGGSNSMIAKFGSQPSSTDIWDGAPTTGFEDRYFVDPGLTTPHVFSLTAGATTLYIGGREADAFLSTITVEAVSTPTPTPTTTPSPGAFVKGININGNAAVINGNPWISYASALASGFATSNPGYTTSITYSPPVDGPTNGMLNTGIWCPACNVNFSQTIANGNYDIYLWAVENYVSNYRSYNVKLEGAQVAAAIGTLSVNTWLRYGPYSVTVSDGVLNVNLVRITGDPLVQGMKSGLQAHH